MSPDLQPNNPRKRKLSDPQGDAPRISLPPSQQSCLKEVTDLIKLQRCTAKETTQVLQAVENVKQALIGAQRSKFASMRDATATFRAQGVHLSYPECGDDIRDAEISLYPPTRIETGWELGCKTLRKLGNGDVSVDLIVQIPSATLHSKDYLEYRYLRKRVIYLSYLLLALKTAMPVSSYSFSSTLLDGDEFRPIIHIECLSWCRIRLIPAISADFFPLDKLSPDACRADRKNGEPTPMYNSSIMDDAYHLATSDILQRHGASTEGFKEATILGGVWLARLGFSSQLLEGGFGEREWALLQCYIMETATNRTVSRYAASSDPFQMFRSVLNLIANTQLPTESNTPTLLQGQTEYNILFKMSRWSFLALRHHSLAVVSLDKLGLSLRSQFQRIFGNPIYQIFDIALSFPVDPFQVVKTLPAICKRWNVRHHVNEYCYNLFSKGLSDRFKIMTFSAPRPPAEKLGETAKPEAGSHLLYNLTVFITLDEKKCSRTLDYGPEVQDTAKTAEFREFWGAKAELRRFKDGRVMETVRWTSTTSPIEQILGFLYQKLMFSFQADRTVTFYGCESDINLESPPLVWPTGDFYETAVSEFEMISNTIRQVKDFPLGFRKISEASPALSLTSVEPPTPCTRHLESPLECELELESSSMWPVDPEQRRRCEFGLLLKLRAELESNENFLTARVGITTMNGPSNTYCFLDLLTKRQYYFRFRLKSLPEVSSGGIHGNLSPNLNWDTLNVELTTPRKNSYPRASIVQRCRQHPYFPPTARLLKKWFQSHYLASFFDGDILELFVAIVFSPYSAVAIPSSTYCGFRRVMAHLSHWDWRRTPLEIDVLRPVPDDERARILKEFGTYQSTNRNSEACLSIVLSSEGGEVDWVRHFVPRLVATRMTQLARETHLKLSDISTSLHSTFKPTVSFFDFVVILELKANPYKIQGRYSNMVTVPKKFGARPVYREFVEELKAQIDEYVLLFPSSDGLTIGGLWKSWNESDSLAAQSSAGPPVRSKIQNKAAIVGLIVELGRGLVNRIQINVSN
ncbi:hypothetical protein TWF481_011147 [Arthrobotrys musiformis]|uniref:U3 small nucleolar RNA-associated protein 22 n=1 Tax=Arthrobotrys musiformis TaxID=47236 RepID=A0AAV9VXJ9_9PEZI